MFDPKQALCDTAFHVYERRMTDAAGGNFSVRHQGRIYCTPKYAGSRHWWRLQPDQIMVTDEQGALLGGNGEMSREWAMHLAVYQAFPQVSAVVHAHAENIMTFAHMRRPIPPTSEQTDRWGTVELCAEYASHTPELAIAVVEGLRPGIGGLPDLVSATLIPRHGVVIACADLFQGVEALEGMDQSCHILAQKAAIEAAQALSRQA